MPLSTRGLPEAEEYGISSLTFTPDRPFHPQRLANVLGGLRRVLRSRGFCWIATRPELAALWSQAGRNPAFEPAGRWPSLDMPPGQEVVFIGVKLDRDRLRAQLDDALLTDAELAEDVPAWTGYADPFPEWGALHEHP